MLTFGVFPATGTMEHSLDNGDGPPCLQVKSCTPEFYQAHYQLVSLHYVSCSSEPGLRAFLRLCQTATADWCLLWRFLFTWYGENRQRLDLGRCLLGGGLFGICFETLDLIG